MSSNNAPVPPSLALVAAAAAAACFAQPDLARKFWERAALPNHENGSSSSSSSSLSQSAHETPSSTNTEKHENTATVLILQEFLLQLALSVIGVAGVWGSTRSTLWWRRRLLWQENHAPRHPAANMLSPLEAKVQALLQGDMSQVESSLQELHQKFAASSPITTIHNHSRDNHYCHQKSGHCIHADTDNERPHRCPEYEHFRTVMRARRRHRHASSVADDNEDSFYFEDSPPLPNHRAQKSLPPEYERFRSVMEEKKARQRKRQEQQQKSLSSLRSRHSTTLPATDEEIFGVDNKYFAAMPHQHTDPLSSWLFDGHTKQLGEVRDLLGTVLGKTPPTPSPFLLASPRRHERGKRGSLWGGSSSGGGYGSSVDDGSISISWGAAAFSDDRSVEIVFDED